MAARGFHHGNLRNELIRLGRAELEAKGHESLSIRDLASRIGVSPSASYRHFKSRSALLLELANEGFERLHAAYLRAAALEASPGVRLRAACKAYLDLAQERPGLFKLIFASQPGWSPEPDSPAMAAFEVFERLVAANRAVECEEPLRPAAIACWSVIHGFAMLRLSQRVAPIGNVDQSEEAVLALACDGQACIGPREDRMTAREPDQGGI